MSESNEERQTNELLALESIYPDKQFVLAADKNGGKFTAHIELPEDFQVAYPAVLTKEEQDIPSDEEPPCETISIRYLPPIILNFEMPANYPSEAPPSYTLTCKWLTEFQLAKLCKHLDNIWSDQGPGFEVLFEWIQFLIDEVLSFLAISSPFLLSRISLKNLRHFSSDKQSNLYDIRASQDIASVDDLVSFLTAYDSHEAVRQFNISYFNCGVCFVEKFGKHCVQFAQCKHIYCTECITNYFLIQIRDGSVRSLNCPEDKCETQADPSLVKRLVPVEVYNQYDKYLLQSTLDCMEDMTYCPRKTCQTAVLLEPDSRNMGRCPGCKLVFCVFCKRTYHGITNCAINNKELLSLRNEYLNGNEEVRNALEKKYGKKRLQSVVDEYYTEAWMEKFSKPCPSCKTSIEKINGCNKMACLKCTCYFCWLCGKALSKVDPYIHFSDFKSPCYNKLFLGADVEVDEDHWSDEEFVEFY